MKYPLGMRSTTQVRYDPAPLLNVAEARATREGVGVPEILGVTQRTISRWRAGKHRITEVTADACAVRLGYHPCLLWPEWWTHAPGESEVVSTPSASVTEP